MPSERSRHHSLDGVHAVFRLGGGIQIAPIRSGDLPDGSGPGGIALMISSGEHGLQPSQPLLREGEPLRRFRAYIAEKGLPLFEISAATGEGLRPLTLAAAAALQKLPPIPVFEEEYVEPEETLDSPEELTIRRQDTDLWVVEGPWLERLLNRVNLSDSEGRMYFDRSLRASGVFERLEDLGVQEGDTISMYDWEFEYKR